MNNNLHLFVNELRKYETEWQKHNPGKHPVVMAKEMALEIVDRVKAAGLQSVEVHKAALSGVTEYGYIISYLEEAGIKVRYLNREVT